MEKYKPLDAVMCYPTMEKSAKVSGIGVTFGGTENQGGDSRRQECRTKVEALGRESLRRPEITGGQPATRLAFTKERTLVGGN